MLDNNPFEKYNYTKDRLLAARDNTVALLRSTGNMQLKILAEEYTNDDTWFRQVLRSVNLGANTKIH